MLGNIYILILIYNFIFREKTGEERESEKMSEIIKNRLKNSIGNKAKIFLHNGFKYEGEVISCDDEYVEILEEKGYKIIEIKDISDLNVEVEK